MANGCYANVNVFNDSVASDPSAYGAYSMESTKITNEATIVNMERGANLRQQKQLRIWANKLENLEAELME